jgi:hypothetical protein
MRRILVDGKRKTVYILEAEMFPNQVDTSLN